MVRRDQMDRRHGRMTIQQTCINMQVCRVRQPMASVRRYGPVEMTSPATSNGFLPPDVIR
jgi:hypothetical protein